MWVYVYECVYDCKCMCMYACTTVCEWIYMHMCVCVSEYMCVWVYVCLSSCGLPLTSLSCGLRVVSGLSKPDLAGSHFFCCCSQMHLSSSSKGEIRENSAFLPLLFPLLQGRAIAGGIHPGIDLVAWVFESGALALNPGLVLTFSRLYNPLDTVFDLSEPQILYLKKEEIFTLQGYED